MQHGHLCLFSLSTSNPEPFTHYTQGHIFSAQQRAVTEHFALIVHLSAKNLKACYNDRFIFPFYRRDTDTQKGCNVSHSESVAESGIEPWSHIHSTKSALHLKG